MFCALSAYAASSEPTNENVDIFRNPNFTSIVIASMRRVIAVECFTIRLPVIEVNEVNSIL